MESANIVSPSSSLSIFPSSRGWKIESIPSVCITLERRLDRWKHFQSQPGVKGLPVKRFLGVDGKTISLSTDDRVATLTKRNIISKSRRSHEELDTIGGVGCALSHIAVWQWMIENKHPICLIFEDDAMVPNDFKEKANHLIETSLLKHPKQWDIWLAGGTWDDLTSIPKETDESGLIRIGSFALFHAYVITLQTAERLVSNAFPIHGHIDVWTSVYAYLNDMRVVGSPSLKIPQNPKTKTDIQPKDECILCNVPANFHETHRMVSHIDWSVARASQILLLAIGVYGIYRIVYKN